MDEQQKQIGKKLRKMTSSEAAEYLLSNHPDDGCVYISKRTWNKEEQLRLAEYFLERIPHGSGNCYESLLSIMPLPKFVRLIEKYVPEKCSDRELLKYYLIPALEKFSKTDKDKIAIDHIQSVMQ